MSEPAIFRRTRIVDPKDVDFLGHVNNVVWVRYVIEVAEAHARSLDMGSGRLRELGGQWIVRRHELDYNAGASTGDEIIEETWVESMRGARSTRRSRFTLARDGTPLVSALTQWAFVDARTLRPRRIGPEVRAAYLPR